MALIGTNYPYSLFSYNKDTATFSVEASDLHGGFLSRLYNDSCDEGFVILGKRGSVDFYLDFIEREGNDGSIVAWHFRARRHRYLNHLKAIVYND